MNKEVMRDRLGREIRVGDYVAYASYHNLGLTIGKITKMGRVRAYVYSDDSFPGHTAQWKREGWTESFHGDALVKITH